MNKILRPNSSQAGFTIIELLIVIVVLGILAGLIYNQASNTIENARYARARAELASISKGMALFMLAENDIPADVDRGLPNGAENYLTNDDWPNGPWPGSVYDWDNYTVGGETTLQVSLRFCEAGNADSCNFPDYEWADDFQVNSSLYYCIFGACQPHPSVAPNYPGVCVNCGDD